MSTRERTNARGDFYDRHLAGHLEGSLSPRGILIIALQAVTFGGTLLLVGFLFPGLGFGWGFLIATAVMMLMCEPVKMRWRRSRAEQLRRERAPEP